MKAVPDKCKWILPAVLLLGALGRGLSHAQTSPAPVPENRYLLVVETSREMLKRAAGVSNAVARLLRSGMEGQIVAGDSLGVWTYNNELHADDLPLQIWTPARQTAVMENVLQSLGTQKWEKQPRFSEVVPALRGVIKSSEFITVILVTSGAEVINGTPFDDKINGIFKNWRAEQQRTRMPFVTVLSAAHGQVTAYSVTPAPWQIEMPPLSADLKLARVVVKPAVVIVAPRKQAPVPSLIISGRKSQTNAAVATPTNIPVAVEPPSAQKIAEPAKAIVPAPQPTPAETAAAAPVAPATAPAPVETIPPAPALSLQPAPLKLNPPQAAALEPPASPVSPTPEPSATASRTGEVGTVQQATEGRPDQEPAAVVATATAPRANTVLYKRFFLVVLAAAGIIGAIVFLRRPRDTQISLITHSMDRDKR